MAISIIEHSAVMTSKVVATFKESIPVAEGFSSWFPRETTPSFYVDIQVQRGTRKIASDVERFTEGQATKSTKVTHNKILPPYYELEYYFNRDEIYMRALEFGALNSPDGNRMIAENALTNLVEQRLMIERSIRKQHADVLQTGVVTLVNGDNIVYRRKAESMVDLVASGGVYWSNKTTATPLADIAKGGKFLRNRGTATGNVLNYVGRSETIAALMATDDFKANADWRHIDRMNIGMPQFSDSTGFTFNGQFAAGDFRVNLWSYDELYEDDNGNDVYYLNQGIVVLLPVNFVGKTVFGALPGMKNATVGGASTKIPAAIETDYLIRPFYDERTLSSGMKMSSAPVVIPVTIDRMYTMKVLA
jgi:hypothetical protein